jgi:hypothetical protein
MLGSPGPRGTVSGILDPGIMYTKDIKDKKNLTKYQVCGYSFNFTEIESTGLNSAPLESRRF